MPLSRRPRFAAALVAALLGLTAVPALAPSAAAQDPAEPVFVVSDVRAELRGSGQQTTADPAPRRALLRSAAAEPTAVFQVRYSGFSSQQRDAFQAAVDTWSRLLVADVPIVIDARISDLPPGVLGAAGPTGLVREDADGRYGPEDTLLPVALANHVAGRDLAPDRADIDAEFASDPSLFSYGPDPEPGRYDFTTVVLHEIGHGLGFTGAMDVLPDSRGTLRGYWSPGTTEPRPLVFDRSTATLQPDGTLSPLLSLQRGSTALAAALTTRRSFWTGRAGTAANGGQPVELYTPDDWQPGSSYSHLDEDLFAAGTPDALMTPTLDLGEVVRDPGNVALGMLADMGWGTSTGALRLSGPSSVSAGASVPVTGVAPPGSVVRIYFKRRGSTTTSPGAQPGFVLGREIVVGNDGAFTTSYVGLDDHRYYATAGDLVSDGVLTQVRPTISGATHRQVPKGSSLSLAGRGLPGTTLALRFTRGSEVDVTRTVTVGSDGTWSRNQVLTEDLRVFATGANGRRSDATVLLQAR